MSLIERQRAFIAEIAADDDVTTNSLGMAIYRNAYRARLTDALGAGFERTRHWVGEDMFALAASHYVLSHPPQSWTIDAYGSHFPQVLGALFAGDPEVAELAWMEWHMQQAFAAADRGEITPGQLAQADLGESDWAELRLIPAAGLASRPVGHDLRALWRALADGPPADRQVLNRDPATLLIWRKQFSPHYRLVADDEFAALSLLLEGKSFGEAAATIGEAGLAAFGQWFAQWLQDGLFSAIAD